jgi:hypothetical protein
LGCGVKSIRPTCLWLSVFRESPSEARLFHHRPLLRLATGGAQIPRPAALCGDSVPSRVWRHVARRLERQTKQGGLPGCCVGVGAPGEGDSTGASAEREGGALIPNRRAGARGASKKEQGRYWHDTAAPPSRGVVRGGLLRTQRTTQPSCMCSFDSRWDLMASLMALANGRGSNAQGAPPPTQGTG